MSSSVGSLREESLFVCPFMEKSSSLAPLTLGRYSQKNGLVELSVPPDFSRQADHSRGGNVFE